MHSEAHSPGTGIVHWNPPQQAMDAVVASAGDHSLNQYGSGAGLPDLVKALKQKLAAENGITQVTLPLTSHEVQLFHQDISMQRSKTTSLSSLKTKFKSMSSTSGPVGTAEQYDNATGYVDQHAVKM